MAMEDGFLGVDVGWVYPAADSDGNVYEWARRRQFEEHFAIAGPVTIRRADGSVETQPAYEYPRGATVPARGDPFACRGVASRVVSLARRTKRTVVLENWTDFSRRKPAWITVWRAIANQADARGVPATQVNRAYTSITCPRCAHKARANRVSRDRFRCQDCGLEEQADIVAARNIAAKAAGRFHPKVVPCSNCDAPVSWRAGLCLFCYRWQRRNGTPPTPHDLQLRRLHIGDDRGFRRLRQSAVIAERGTDWSARAHALSRAASERYDLYGRPRDVSAGR